MRDQLVLRVAHAHRMNCFLIEGDKNQGEFVVSAGSGRAVRRLIDRARREAKLGGWDRSTWNTGTSLVFSREAKNDSTLTVVRVPQRGNVLFMDVSGQFCLTLNPQDVDRLESVWGRLPRLAFVSVKLPVAAASAAV